MQAHSTTRPTRQQPMLLNYGEPYSSPFSYGGNMRIRITRPGIYRNGTTQIAVGDELEVPDDFTGWQNKWVRVDSPKATLEVASPAPAEEPDTDLEEARAEYEATFGERPHPRMKADTIRARISEAQDDE